MNNHYVLINTSILIAIFSVADCVFWSCYDNGTALPVVPRLVAGDWYEIARIPSSDVPACLKVIAPDTQVDGNYTLQLDYINNVNNGWEPTQETLEFPWSEARKGQFNLKYTDGSISITLRFKYLGSIMGYTVVCGYSDFAPGLSIMRILSRERLVNDTVKAEINALANEKNINLSQLTWVEQDEKKCNGTGALSTFTIGILLFIYLLQNVL